MDFEEFSELVYMYTFLNYYGRWVPCFWRFRIKPGVLPGKKNTQIVLHSEFRVIATRLGAYSESHTIRLFKP